MGLRAVHGIAGTPDHSECEIAKSQVVRAERPVPGKLREVPVQNGYGRSSQIGARKPSQRTSDARSGVKSGVIECFLSVFLGFQMNLSRQFVAGIATLISLAFLTVDYLFHHSHVTLFFLYFWMVVYFLFAMAVIMAVMMCVDLAFQAAKARGSSLPRGGRSSRIIAGWVISGLLTWIAFWQQHIFLWMVFALALIATFWIRLNEWRCTPRSQ